MTINKFKNKFNIGKIYGAKVFDDTVHYQKNIISILEQEIMPHGTMKQMPLNTHICKPNSLYGLDKH